MFRELLGRRRIDKKIEKHLIDLSLIPSKYFEALYIERRTEISSPVFELLEEEEKEKRGELIELLKEGIVDTKIEIAKYELYERMVGVTSVMKEVRVTITDNKHRIGEEEYKELINILKEVSQLGKIMFEMVKNLYCNYNLAKKNMKHILAQANGFGEKGEKIISIASMMKWEAENLSGTTKASKQYSHINREDKGKDHYTEWPTTK